MNDPVDNIRIYIMKRKKTHVKDLFILILQLKEGDINTDKARYQLFLQLLSKSSNYNHFNSICDLLQLWPPLKAASSR